MGMYRKLPVIVEARQLSCDNVFQIVEWCWGCAFNSPGAEYMAGNRLMYVDTLEGRMFAEEGDWIIKGVAGEFYPCKPDIFDKTYTEDDGCPND